jgi:APA family basic amino acid/polyamine antiporter
MAAAIDARELQADAPSPDRPFGVWTATALVVGGMIGAGIFMLPASIAPYGWTSLVGWVIAITGVLSIAYALSKLSAVTPEATGAIAVTSAALGPFAALMVGWAYWVSCWTGNAGLAIASISYLSVLVPALNATPQTGSASAVALLWLITLLNFGGAKAAGRFQVVTTLLKLIPLAMVLGVLLWLGLAGDATVAPLPRADSALTGLTAVVTLAFFPFLGFEAAGMVAGRVRNPARNVLRATMAGTAFVGLLYLIVCSGIVLTMGPGLATSDAPIAAFIETHWGPRPAQLVALFASVSAIGCLNCWVLLQAEVPLGMARAGLLPDWFAKVSDGDVPQRLLVLSSTLATVLVLSNASSALGGIYLFIALLTACTSLWLYAAICVSALVKRVARPAALIGLPFTAWAMWGAGIEPSLLGLGLTLTALPFYLMRRIRLAKLALAVPAHSAA